jgi:hypothetical protein
MVLVPQHKRRKERGDRIFTFRVALFVLVMVAVLGGAAGLVLWFDKASFFVGIDRGYVAIFQGRPGGLLWLKPSVVERTTLKPSDLLASNVVYLRQGMEESSYAAARDLVRNLSLERSRLGTGEPPTTTSPASAGTVTTTSRAPVAAGGATTTSTVPAATSTTAANRATTTTIRVTTTLPGTTVPTATTRPATTVPTATTRPATTSPAPTTTSGAVTTSTVAR